MIGLKHAPMSSNEVATRSIIDIAIEFIEEMEFDQDFEEWERGRV